MRYAVLSDVHGNLPALEAVIEDLNTNRQYDFAIYLGDAVGYYPNAAEVIGILRDIVKPHPVRESRYLHQPKKGGQSKKKIPLWVTGNHDHDLVTNNTSQQEVSQVAMETTSLTRKNLEEHSSKSLDFLSTIPYFIEVELGEKDDALSVTLVHTSPHEPDQVSSYINNPYSAKMAANAIQTQICMVGHTHVPLIFRMVQRGFSDCEKIRIMSEHVGGFGDGVHQTGKPFPIGTEKIILNPGSVGQPRDGNNNASYAILDTKERTFTVYRVPYDIERTQQLTREWLVQTPLSERDVTLHIERLGSAIG